MDDIKIGKTKHGLRVIQVNRQKNPKLIYVHLEVGVGSDIETKNELEICHFLEHLFVSLTSEKFPDSVKNREVMAKNNISYSANSGSKNTSYEYSFEKKHFGIFLTMLINALVSFKVDSKIFKKEQASIVEEINELIESPEFEIETKLNEIMFNSHIRSTSEREKLKFVKKVTAKKIQEFWNSHYKLSNIVLSIYGSVKLETVINDIDKIFTSLKSTPSNSSLLSSYLPFKKENLLDTHVAFTKSSTSNALLTLAWKLNFDVFSDEFYPLFAIDFLLFNDLTSLVMKRLRGELGLIYDIESSFLLDEFQPELSYFSLQTSTNSSNILKVINEIIKIVKQLSSKIVSNKKFNEYLEAQRLQILQNNENLDYKTILENYSKQLLWKNKVISHSKEERKYLQVTKQDIKKSANEIFQNKNLFISYQNSKNINSQINKLLN
jgi:predicted Zn-dependent peptidase